MQQTTTYEDMVIQAHGQQTTTYEDMVIQAHGQLMEALPQEFTAHDRAQIEDAYLLAKEAHSKQVRKSGLPYILHPLAVSLIVVQEMRQRDPSIVCAALLHDVVEDTPHTIQEIEEHFGQDVAFLVNSVTKPNKEQVDNFQHILSSVQGDVRVLILKLSDRLHNMRTLDGLRPQKQWKIASETQFFFAPLAGRLGLYKVKSELENLAFRFLNPEEYELISKALEEDRERTKPIVESFMKDAMKSVADELGDAVKWDIRYRKPYSIYREMHERGCDFYHVPFKHFIRAGFEPEEITRNINREMSEADTVLKIYSILAQHYKEQTGSFVNYLSQPKANGYRSIHVRLLNPFGSIEEFHIASNNMRLQSNYGCIVESKEQWMKRVTSVLEELAKDPESMMLGIRDSLYNEDVVVYTPKVQTITLPKGATALDFAYEVHTEIGNHAKVARINGHLCSIRTVLHRGDSVEIGTDPKVHPSADWLSAVVTYKAKKQIRNYLKSLPAPQYTLCTHCHPLPESGELIGFDDGHGHITIHNRNCPEAIRHASEQGQHIVAVENFRADPDVLYPVKIQITGIDRYHLMRDIMDCIVEDHHLSMTGLSTKTKDNIVTCSIDFAVHSAREMKETIQGISAIEGVEEVRRQ